LYCLLFVLFAVCIVCGLYCLRFVLFAVCIVCGLYCLRFVLFAVRCCAFFLFLFLFISCIYLKRYPYISEYLPNIDCKNIK